jgi:hypothetical protein
MLIQRIRPKDTEGTMYHYCSAQTFLSIIQNRTIRLSDINLLNDAEEGRWGYRIFIEAVNQLLKREGRYDASPDIPTEFFDKIDAQWSSADVNVSSFIACFSTDGDSLSQWRAYADDGRGFAIGFKAREVRRLPIQLLDVLYDREKQVEEMADCLGATFLEFQDRGSDLDDPWFFQRSAEIAASSVALKNPAWRDEKEVRCHHLVRSVTDAEGWQLVDDGGFSDDVDVPGQPIHFQARNGTIVPFLDMPFEVSKEHQPIQEVVLGPRCPNDLAAIRFVLGNSGYGSVPLKSAGNAYR